ncbi:uncharacterized protein LOC120341444 [Styela clava]
MGEQYHKFQFQLHGETGGNVQPQFSDTLKWFYKRTVNPKDKEHCLRLLAQIELKGEEVNKAKASFQPTCGSATGGERVTSKRPSSAKVPANRVGFATHVGRPKSAFQEKKSLREFSKTDEEPNLKNDLKEKSSYQKQKESIHRLSRPKTTNLANNQQHSDHRPKSAMAAIGGKRYDHPYLTTHEREFPGYSSGLCAEAKRPMSSKGFTAPYELSGPIGGTTCTQEFGWKKATKNEPIRSGTSSGNRRNNPHPHESFMVWKLPNKQSAKGMITATAPHLQYRELTNEVLDQILRDQHKSTYQCDYLGIPQGYHVKTAIDAPADWRAKVRRPLDTTVRYSYMRPQQHVELVGNTTRYGCNKKKGVAALGAVPTVTSNHVKNQEVIKGKTTYDTEFRNRYSQPDLEKLLNNQTNKKVMDQFLRYARTDAAKTTMTRGSRPGSTSSQTGPKWLPKWEGPHHHEHQ